MVIVHVICDLPPGTRRNTYLPPEPTKGYNYETPSIVFSKSTIPFSTTPSSHTYPKPTTKFPTSRPFNGYPPPTKPTPEFPDSTRPTGTTIPNNGGVSNKRNHFTKL